MTTGQIDIEEWRRRHDPVPFGRAVVNGAAKRRPAPRASVAVTTV
jgi:hypothetical protein